MECSARARSPRRIDCASWPERVPLSESVLRTLYANRAQYESRVAQRLAEALRDGWYLPEYAGIIAADGKASRVP